mgnify:CR=1 FL=1
MDTIVGVKELRQNLETYVREVKKGKSFMVVRRSKPLFRLSPLEEGEWETVIDFTRTRKGGVPIRDILSRL